MSQPISVQDKNRPNRLHFPKKIAYFVGDKKR